MISTVTLTALATLAPAAPADAPDRLITRNGVELRADEDVFVLFAALNAAGYSEETKRKGPPLQAPVFHDIRVDVREQLREVRESSSFDAVRKLFADNPGEIEDYLAAVLADRKAKGLSKSAAALQGKVEPVLAKFREEGKLAAVFDKVAEDQREHAKALKALLEKDFVAAHEILGDATLRAPTSLVVVPNPLDGHAMVRELEIGGTRFIVVGPGHDTARRAILEAALEPAIAKLVDDAWPRAKGFRRSWDGLKTSRRIAQRYDNGKNYLTVALTQALAHRVALASAGAKPSRDADEDFIDEQARQGMRWARASLKVLDRLEAGTPVSEQLPKIVSKVGP